MASGPPPQARAIIRQFLSEREERVWLDFLEIHTTVVREADARLTEEHRLPMSAFDILMRVAHADDAVLSISALARQVPLSPSQVSRIVIDLERRGLLARRPNADDARSTCAAMTDLGFAILHDAAPSYLGTLRERFFDRLEPADVEHLGAAWRHVLDPPAS